MRLYDVTLPIAPGMPVYPGDPEVAVRAWCSLASGAPFNLSQLSLGVHTGTHVDAPRHFRAGAPGVDRLPLEALIGPARLVDLGQAAAITAEMLRELDLGGSLRLLFRTRNSAAWRAGRFPEDPAGLSGDAARLLVEQGVRLVGLDSPSADAPGAADFPAHRTLLEAGVIILEGLDLFEVSAGEYELLCLPLRIVDGDGGPARVVLRERTAGR